MRRFRGLRYGLALALALAPVAEVSARGFGGGGGGFRGGGGGGGGFRGGGGGGFRGGGGGGGGGFRGGGYGGGFGGGGYRGGNFSGNTFRGGSEFNRTPSFSSGGGFQPHYQNFNSGNRSGFENRGNINAGNFNRPASANSFSGGNRPFNQTNVNNFNRGNFNNADGFNRAGVGNYGWHGNAYAGYHSGWVNGYWPGHYNNWGGGWGGSGYGGLGYGGYGWGLGTGLALGSLASWAYGPMLYNWGYSSYNNPYYGGQSGVIVAGQPAVYNYSTPINTQAAPPADDAKDPALQTFESARMAFKGGDYTRALQQADQALEAMPGDSAFHQFRALCLFALGRFDEDASTLYAVLSAGPGWDWTTLIGLYPDVDTYTTQLRALEAYVTANTESSSGRFDLAYQYMTQGHAEAAVRQLKVVLSLQPSDKISAQLIQQLTPPPAGTTTPAADGAEQVPANPVPDNNPPQGTAGDIDGTWTATPTAKVSIALTLKKDGPFTWKVSQAGTPHEFSGDSTFGDNLLTLAPKGGGTPMVGKLIWQDPNHFKFQVAGGGGPNDPGLAFSR